MPFEISRKPLALRVAVLLCSLLVAACSKPVQQEVQKAEFAPVLSRDFLIQGMANRLPIQYWLPKGEPKAVIIGVHGFNEYSRAFEVPGLYFSERGIAFYTYDQRGFGATASHGIWAGEDNLSSDLAQMVTAVKEAYPDVPVYVLGESMGGAVIITSLVKPDFPHVDGVILSAPAVWGNETMNVFYRMTLWTLAHTMPDQSLTGKQLQIVPTDNMDMLQQMGRDPLVIKSTRIDAIYGIVKLMDSAFTHIDAVKTPILFLYGAKDQVIPKQPVKVAIDKIHAPYNVALYPDGYHMLLRDMKGQVVLGDIESWIESPKKALPSGYDQNWRDVLK